MSMIFPSPTPHPASQIKRPQGERCPGRVSPFTRRALLPLTLSLFALLSCAPTTLPAETWPSGGQGAPIPTEQWLLESQPPTGDGSAGTTRERYSRTHSHPCHRIRWIEVTLHERRWVSALLHEWARYSRPSPEEKVLYADELASQYLSGGIGFEVWFVTSHKEISNLADWEIQLRVGKDISPPGSVQVESRVLRTTDQTRTLLDVTRILQLHHVKGTIKFPDLKLPAKGGRLRLTLTAPPAAGQEEGNAMDFRWATDPD